MLCYLPSHLLTFFILGKYYLILLLCSAYALPKAYAQLMLDEQSKIFDLYPQGKLLIFSSMRAFELVLLFLYCFCFVL